MSDSKKIAWQSWNAMVTEFYESDMDLALLEELFSSHTHEEPNENTLKFLDPAPRVLYTPYGPFPTDSFLKPSDRWDCWICHTNFDVTVSIIENIEEIFSIGLNRAITLIAEAKPGRISSSIIKDLGEHPEDKKPVRIMKGQYGPYIKYKSLNATIPEEKDPTELTMEEALILIEKRKEYDKTKKSKKRKAKWVTIIKLKNLR